MRITKKVLGVLVALAMLVNVFAMFSSAKAPDSAIDLYLSVDKESYAPGEEVTITVSEQVIDAVGDMRVGGGYAIGYNSGVIDVLSTNKENPQTNHGFVALQGGYDDSISGFSFTDDQLGLGDTIDEGHDWNAIVLLNIADDLSTSFSATEKTDVLEFKMKLSDTVADGDYVIGFNKGSYDNYSAYSNDAAMGGVYGSYDDYGYGTACNYSCGTATIKVRSAAAVPSVVKSAGQIKMTATSATTVEDAFQLRITSKITAADWDANFANTAVDGATANYITKVGMVAYTGTADAYSLDDAKAAIAAGASNGNYYYGDTDYIKHADGEDATFGTVLKCTHGSEKLQNDPICLGFVSYVDAAGQAQTIYYAETYTAPIVSNYDALATSYAQTYFGK